MIRIVAVYIPVWKFMFFSFRITLDPPHVRQEFFLDSHGASRKEREKTRKGKGSGEAVSNVVLYQFMVCLEMRYPSQLMKKKVGKAEERKKERWISGNSSSNNSKHNRKKGRSSGSQHGQEEEKVTRVGGDAAVAAAVSATAITR